MKSLKPKKRIPVYRNLDRLNRLPHDEAVRLFLQCCGSRQWAEKMAAARPFLMLEHLFSGAAGMWDLLSEDEKIRIIETYNGGDTANSFANQEQNCIVRKDGAKVVRFPSEPAISGSQPIFGLRFAAARFAEKIERRLSSILET